MNLLSYLIPLEITKVNSPLNGEIKVVERFGKRTLLVNDAEQSGGTITEMWENSISKIPASPAGRKNQKSKITNCLVLGLGGGTIIDILHKRYPSVKSEVIEFDPVIIDVAQKYFGIKSSSELIITQRDAFSWVKKTKVRYDLIVFDLFSGKFNPGKSREFSFLKDLKNLLIPSGYILYNAHYQQDEENFRKLLKECGNVFPRVKLLLLRPYSRILLLGN